MKLSDAAVLGAATWKRVCYPAGVNRHPRPDAYKTEGCFLQIALRAVGFSAEEVSSGNNWAKLTAKMWPWTKADDERCMTEIWQMNDLGAPFEDILAYVRRHEPAEPASDTPSEAALEAMRENEYDTRANTR